MNTFTFVTLSYNQENEIEQHLESIKRIIVKYGKGISISYILCDDCSKDRTVDVVIDWIKRNPLFQSVKISKNSINIGTVNNYIQAVSMVETEDFKILAGDDMYGFFNIFALYDSLGDSLLFTPITPFGQAEQRRLKLFENNFRLLMYMYKKGCVANSICFTNLIPAPGVFYKLSLIKDKNLIDFLMQFKYIEDYPLFYYLIQKKHVNVIIDNHSYIYYRLGSGVSTNLSSSIHKDYLQDRKRITMLIKPKLDIMPKYINPYRYYFKLLRVIIGRQKKTYPIFLMDTDFNE